MNDSMSTVVVNDLQVLLNSRKFREWKPRIVHRKPVDHTAAAVEKHYSVNELAELWGCSADTIRLLFENEDGVLIIGNGKGTRSKRRYRTFKIPQSVAIQVHSRMSRR